ncbi:MAG: DUF6491 family protein [Steroidobacteraceae bacterium]
MKPNYWNAVVLLSAALITAACSGIPRRERDQETLDRYLRYAGPPVDHISLLGRYDNWQPVSRYQVVLWTGINDAYLITVASPCENLQFAQRVGITQTANTISSKFDAVLVKGWRCQITEIRPIDYKRLRQDLREEHAREKAEKAEKAQP